MATPVANSRKALPDAELADLAIAGDGRAFAELYDRHEQRVHGFCARMLRGPHDAAEATQETFVRMLARLPALEDRELNFVAYTLATARNVCYDMIRARRTVEPVAEQPEGVGIDRELDDIDRDPERFALLSAAREEVRAANAALPPRQREVLALREVELLSYDEIGELMGLNRNAVAQLVSRARIGLRGLLRDSALASVGARTPACDRALALLATLQDGQGEGSVDLDWIDAHLADCEHCRLARTEMEEAGASYRALGLLVPLAWLRHATIARAAEYVGADWSQVAEAPKESETGGPESATPSPRRRLAIGALLMLALCAGLLFVIASDTARDSRQPSPTAAAVTANPTAGPLGQPRHSHAPTTAPAGALEHPPHQAVLSTVSAPAGSTPTTQGTPVIAAHPNRRGTHRRRSRPIQHHSTPVSSTPPAVTTTPPTPPPSTPPPVQTAPTTTAPSGTTTTTTSTEAPGGTSTATTPAEPPGTPAGPGLIP